MNIREHLISRHFDFGIHRAIVSEEEQCSTTLLYNLSGQITGYQRYRPDRPSCAKNDVEGRYYNWNRPEMDRFFGIETYKTDAKVIFVVEGVFDATRLTSKGCTCFALMTNAPSQSMLNFLACLPQKIVAVCDNDKGGEKLARVIKPITKNILFTDKKDLGEESEEYVQNLIKCCLP